MSISSPSVKKILSGFLVLCALAILVSLGVWQLQRKAWKEALIADINARAHSQPVAISPEKDWVNWDPAKDEFRHVTVTGTYAQTNDIAVYGLMQDPKTSDTLQGHYLFSPLLLENGTAVFINRGFVPNDIKIPSPPIGIVTVEGILRAPEQKGWFVPANQPEKGEWFTRDAPAMAAYKNLARNAPFYIEADAKLNETSTTWPRGGVTREITLKNDHLQYALTWFGLATVLLGITGYALVRK
ncbi:SURF1 family protein [Microvirga sp. W0021]|uniref:SURF1-like protein n=1 Tax=Hohaiivirga grylli TaxID=3133970 RepID=A0ABV0BHC3_9HYPH